MNRFIKHIKGRHLSVFVFCLILVFCFRSASAASKAGIVLGDSIGVGISMASGLPRLAKNSVLIKSTEAINQLQQVPSDTVAILSLGTNDAVGNISGVEPAIDNIVKWVQKSGITVVWVGPPCVIKPWNTNVEKLDSILNAKLAGQKNIRYLSIADKKLCDPSLRGRDGVHFNMKGYGILWSRTQEVAGLQVTKPSSPKPQVKKAKKKKSKGNALGNNSVKRSKAQN
jgi:hypothetical protein